MKVKELIEILKQYNDDDIVVTDIDEDFYDIRAVYIDHVKINVRDLSNHGDYYSQTWDECPDPQVSVLVLSKEES